MRIGLPNGQEGVQSKIDEWPITIRDQGLGSLSYKERVTREVNIIWITGSITKMEERRIWKQARRVDIKVIKCVRFQKKQLFDGGMLIRDTRDWLQSILDVYRWLCEHIISSDHKPPSITWSICYRAIQYKTIHYGAVCHPSISCEPHGARIEIHWQAIRNNDITNR